jgi:hypothetical protein
LPKDSKPVLSSKSNVTYTMPLFSFRTPKLTTFKARRTIDGESSKRRHRHKCPYENSLVESK